MGGTKHGTLSKKDFELINQERHNKFYKESASFHVLISVD